MYLFYIHINTHNPSLPCPFPTHHLSFTLPHLHGLANIAATAFLPPAAETKKQKKPSTSVQHRAALLHHSPSAPSAQQFSHTQTPSYGPNQCKNIRQPQKTPRKAHTPPDIHATYRKQTRYHTTKLHRTNLQWKGYVCLVHLLFSNGEKGLRRLLAGNN